MNVSVDGQLPRDDLRRWMSEGHRRHVFRRRSERCHMLDPHESNKRAHYVFCKASVNNSYFDTAQDCFS